jgi:hypothetical protein
MIGRSANPIVRTTSERASRCCRVSVGRRSAILGDDAEPFHAELERRPEHLALARVNRRNTS